jgi:hypothetical protein
MNAPRRSDSIAEGVIVALVVVVLGVAATGVRLEPVPQGASVDRLAAQVRMQMPIAPGLHAQRRERRCVPPAARFGKALARAKATNDLSSQARPPGPGGAR